MNCISTREYAWANNQQKQRARQLMSHLITRHDQLNAQRAHISLEKHGQYPARELDVNWSHAEFGIYKKKHEIRFLDHLLRS